VVTAAPQDQWRLLDVQAHDTRLAQIAHRLRTLPEHAEIDALDVKLRAVTADLVTARTVAGDVKRELNKAEADVELVRRRADRDRARLDSGQGTAKDLQATQHELVSLTARQSALEDVELEVMERLETAQGRVAAAEAEQARLEAQIAEAAGRRDAAVATLEAEADGERAERGHAVAGLPADLVALYEKIRAHSDGLGAARLRQRRCEGCRMELTPVDMGRIRAAAQDEVLRCEECRRILVRTADSGL